MSQFVRRGRRTIRVLAAGLVLLPAVAGAQTFALDPPSASLAAIPAGPGDLLQPSGPLPAVPPPTVAVGVAALGLLPGDVIDAITYGDDGPVGGTLHFSVTRPSVGAFPGPFPPDVFSEVALVPPGIQPEAAGDLFATFDPACAGPGLNSQVTDGNGMALGPLACYPGLGLGLAEALPLPGPPLVDNLAAFDWAAPGRYPLFCVGFSLAAGSPTLTPGTNPSLPPGAEPGDIIVSCPGAPLFVFAGAATLGLVSGGPGCAPPACDDLDALSLSFPGGGTVLFSLAPGSPSLGACPYSPADVLGGVAPPIPPCAVPFAPAPALGLVPADDVDALEVTTNACPAPAAVDAPDFDGIGPCDNCLAVFNPGQEDTDGDGVGDTCDGCTDLDGDGFGNAGFPANVCAVDLCPFVPGPNVDTDGDGLADECDNCPATPNPGQADSDLDTAGDACDPCPHVAGAAPLPMAGLRRVLLVYGASGPGGGDDRPKAIKAEFTTGAPFDPDSTDNVHLTLQDAGTGATMFAASLASASGFWTQPNPTKLTWKYSDPAAGGGVRKALLKERPPTSTAYQFKLVGKGADVAGPLVGPGVTATLEIETGFAGVCFSQTNLTCTSTPTKDRCDP